VTSPWWAAFGPAQTQVSCGSGQHRMRWSDGQFQAADHSDAEGELVLAALGGDATPCLDLANAWGKHGDDLTALAIGPRSAVDKLTFTPEIIEEIAQARTAAAGGSGWSSATGQVISHRLRATRTATSSRFASGGGFTSAGVHAPGWARGRVRLHAGGGPARLRRTRPFGMSLMGWRGGHTDPSRAELIWLLTLGAPFQFRLSGAVAHAWSAEGQHASRAGQARPALTAALAGRLAPAVARWLGVDPAAVDANIHDDGDWGAIEEARAAGERRLQAGLPVSWLARVWAPGLAVVGGHLVVSVVHAAWPTADVLALTRPATTPVELSVRHDGQGWITA
jgi:hypothetical protein